MKHFSKFGIAVAALMIVGTGATYAADIIDPQVIEVQPLPSVGGWYLRGHIGMSNQRLGELQYQYFDVPGYDFSWLDDGGFGSAPIFGAGVGYQINDWFRTDATVEYRGKASFTATDRFINTDTGVATTNNYSANKSEWLLLANAYVDLGSVAGITPYVGAGVGASRNTISNFYDRAGDGGGGFAGTDSKWNFAWALHAGVGIKATERLTIDLGYSYVDLGDGQTAQAYNSNYPEFSRPNDGFKFKDITSHDVKLGMRYAFN